MSRFKNWTKEEEDFLEDKWGEMSIGRIAKKLDRSEAAVIVRARRLGLGPHLDAGDCVSMNQLVLAVAGTKSYGYITKRWLDYGLPVHGHKVRRCRFRVVRIEDFWKWAEAHKDILNFKRFEENALGAEPAWVKVKRKADMETAARTKLNNNIPWTAGEDAKLQRLVDRGKTYPEIAAELRKTEGAIKRRLFDAGIRGRPARSKNRMWTEEEAILLLKLRDSGLGWLQLAERFGRSELAVRGKYERLANPEYMRRYCRGKAKEYQYVGIRDLTAEEILHGMEDRKTAEGGAWTELKETGGEHDRTNAV